MIYEVSLRSSIDVRTGVKATADLLKAEAPDVVILAAGAHEKKIPIPGIENAIPALDVFREGTKISQKVVMVGGGLVGAETGLHLAHTGHEVTVVEMIKRIAHESCGIYRKSLMEEIEKANIQCYVKTKCKEIRVVQPLILG